jgi:hypothetical protein
MRDGSLKAELSGATPLNEGTFLVVLDVDFLLYERKLRAFEGHDLMLLVSEFRILSSISPGDPRE